MVSESPLIEHLFRHHAGRLTARLVGEFGLTALNDIEDAVQDAMLRALKTWPYRGIPENPQGWISKAAKNRLLDLLRRQQVWQKKVRLLEVQTTHSTDPQADYTLAGNSISDDQLRMVFTCCHPDIPAGSQIPLTLKTVCGFSVTEIARAFLLSPTTMAQRITRAKRRLKTQQIPFAMPPDTALPERLNSVLQVIYLIFNEGYAATSGDDLLRQDLCQEAIRLAQGLACQQSLAQPQLHALLALLLLQAARFPARTDAAGDLILLADQDRRRWDQKLIQLGMHHFRAAASGNRLSSFHWEAEISVCHAMAENIQATDWQRVAYCYRQLLKLNTSPVIAINHAVALLHTEGAHTALQTLMEITPRERIEQYYPYHIAKAHCLSQLGRTEQARKQYQKALQLTENAPLRRFLLHKINTGAKHF